MERLDKLLSSTGRWSRKEAEQLIRSGRVTVDEAADGRQVLLSALLPSPQPVDLPVEGSHLRRGIYLSHAE